MGSTFGLAIIVMAVILGAAALWRRFGRKTFGSPGRRFKCHDCEHLRRSFDDGVMCGYGASEVFKTRAHIRMCPDWTPRRRG
jgi:hypothetical protein